MELKLDSTINFIFFVKICTQTLPLILKKKNGERGTVSKCPEGLGF